MSEKDLLVQELLSMAEEWEKDSKTIEIGDCFEVGANAALQACAIALRKALKGH